MPSQRLLDMFRAEAREALAALAAGALQVERGDAEPGAVGALFRSAHTLKGGARMLGLDDVASAAEAVEQALAPHRGADQTPPAALGGEVLAGVETLRALIWPDEVGTEGGLPAGGAMPHVTEVPTVRVRANRIGAVLDLVAEARRVASRAVAPADSGDRSLDDLLSAAEEGALRLRLLPLGGMFDGLRLAVREAAAADGKRAELEARGGEVEADAAVVDVAAEVILQLVRNAVAHGVEPPEERAGAGKPEIAKIEVEVRSRGGWLELSVADDGRGVDEDAVRRRAAALRLAPDQPVEELLFAPGLSTRARADQLGGQGVGLDVVRARTRAAGGEATASWRAGRGTTFVVRLPVSALYERLVAAELDGTLVGVPVDAVADVRAGADAAAGLGVNGRPNEISVLTVPLGPLFARSSVARRAWIAPDGRVGVVLEREALGG